MTQLVLDVFRQALSDADLEVEMQAWARHERHYGRAPTREELRALALKQAAKYAAADDLIKPRDREEIAASAARKIVNTPAVTEEYVRAIILDGLNEAADIERHCADVDREVFGN